MQGRYLKLEEIKVGDRVNTYQLANIYDTYILLSNTQIQEDGSTEGTIEFIGKVQNQKMRDILNMCKTRDGKKPMIYAHKQMENGAYSL
ncbi:MAG: hypothetical protein IJX86_12965 [Lachnospiraceae bacterium]|nr:hypothetical protein [Lachnospiraceae bacterium]